jgi:translocation and assembly module TamB
VSEASAQPVRRWWKSVLIVAGAGLLCILALLLYINTDSFQSYVRRRLVAEVERTTGGRAEVGSFHTIPFRLQVEVRDITVHGLESASDVPLAHADRVVARVKLFSLLQSELGFHEILLDHPVIHVAFYPDGTTNFPKRAGATSGQSPIERLFSLSITQLELRHGRIVWDDQSIPIEFAARDTSLRMEYSYLHRRYDGRLLFGLVDTKLPDCRPFAWMTSAEFSLASDSAIVTSFKWNSGHSNLAANGAISNFRHPRVQARYEAHLDLTEAASITRHPDLHGGALELKGDGDWALDAFDAKGLLTLRDVGWQDGRIAFSRASLSTGYSVTDQQLTFSKLQGKIFGGSITGQAELSQWLAPDQHLSDAARKTLETATISAARPFNKTGQPARPKPAPVQSALVSLRLHDISFENLATAITVPGHPLQALHPAGLASGTLETRWKGTRRDAEVHFILNVNPPAKSEAAALPITAQASGEYHAATGTLDLPQFNLATRTSHIQASGTLSSTSALRLSVTTSSLADWLPFVAAVRGPALFPVVLNGHADFNGNLTGDVLKPQLGGTLQAEDFEVNLSATDGAPEIKTQWDSLATSIQLSSRAVSLRGATLKRGDTSAEFDGSATLDRGHLVGDSIVSIRANLHNADLDFLQAMLRYHYPVSGKADLVLQASGTISSPLGEGRIHLTNASAFGQSIQKFDSNFNLARGEIELSDLRLLYNNSITTGSAAYTPGTRAFRLDLAGNNFDLTALHRLQTSRFPLEGRADFNVKASGTRAGLSISGDAHLHGFTLNHELLGDLDLQAVTAADELQITGNSQLPHGSLALSGKIRLRDDYPADLSFRMDQFDVDALWRAYFGAQLTGHSAVAGTVNLHGPFNQWSRWAIEGNLSAVALDLEHVKLHSQEPVRFALAGQSLKILQLHMLGEGTDLTARGSVQLAGVRTLDLAADGRLDLKLLSGLDPDISASGLVTLDMTVGGSLSDPLPQGRIQLSSGTLAYSGLPSGLGELSGSLLFTRDHAHIETLTARTGGGTLTLKGDATYVNRQLNFNLSASGKDVRLRYPPGVSSTANTDLRWVGSRSSSTLSGEITIAKMAVTPGFDFSTYLERGRQGSALNVANSPLNNIKLDIHVQTAPELQMRTAIARLSGDADLRLRGSAARPAVLGRVDILEGRATFHGTRYTLERGDITFANPVSIEPQLNLQAATHVRNYDLNITVTGTPDRGLNLNYRSEPPLPKSDIIALLALGRTGDESAQLEGQSGQSAFSDQATALILSQALNGSVSSRFQRLFGASNIKIDPQGLTTENNPISNGPQITIEQEFANNVSLTYSTNVSQSSQQIIQGEYYFNRNVSVVGTRDQNGVVSFDLRVRHRKK